MNRTLFVSGHALAALAVVVAFSAWLLLGGHAAGRGAGSDVDLLLWSGWTALGLFLVILLYTARKHVHRTAHSPELRLRVPVEDLERAERRINELRREIAEGVRTSVPDVRERARQILRETGVGRVLALAVRSGGAGEPAVVVEARPTEPLGRVARWMHAHLYYGLAAAVLVLLHGGGHFASPMAALLNGLALLVITSGLAGIAVWAAGPTWLTRAERDLTSEEAFALERTLSAKLDRVLANEPVETSPKWRARAKPWGALEDDQVAALHELRGERRRFRARAEDVLAEVTASDPANAAYVRDVVALLGQLHRVRSEARRLGRWKVLLDGWRLVHVPLSVALVGVLVVHLVSVWWY